MRSRFLPLALMVLLAGCGSSASQPATVVPTAPAATVSATDTSAPTSAGGTATATTATPRPHKTSAASPTATQAGRNGVEDKATGVQVSIGQVLIYHTYSLLYITMQNASGRLFSPVSAQPQFEEASFTTVASAGTAGGCGSDDSRGTPLDFVSIPPHTTHAGWVRCDYPAGSKIFDVTWLGHELGHFNINV